MRVLILLLAGAAAPAFAADEAVDAADAAASTLHGPASNEIVVTAPYARDRASLLSGTTVLQGTELTRQIRSTIGETLSRQAGVSATSFGPNASRPILRGFQGERVRVLSDGIGSFDVSNTSVDHAVVVNPQLAERIEVLRGPASLLYGSSAIGGVVNVIDKRIPREVPDEPVHLDLEGTYASAARERSAEGVVEVPVGPRFVVHADGSYTRTSDLGIGGYVLSKPVRAAALASTDPAVTALAGLRGRLPNSAGRTWNAGVGGAFIDAGGELGFAISRYDSVYGVPARYDIATGMGEQVHLAVEQTRLDVRGSVALGDGFFEKLTARYGYADYRHRELAETGATNTTFLNKSMEGRLEIAQARRGAWRGASGLQLLTRTLDIIGDEAFVPRNTTTQIGAFTLQELDFGAFKAEAAARFEHSSVTTALGAFRSAPNAFDRSFDAVSGSIGASYGLAPGVRIGINLSHTERAPAAEELLADGPHAGTQAFEIGRRDFGIERGNGAEIVVRARGDAYSLEGSLYYTRFTNYIFETQTGGIDDGLPVFQFNAGRARYYGAELTASATVARLGDMAVKVDALADYTNADLLDGGGPVPRIPPFRILGGVEVTHPRGDARIEAEHAARQGRVSPFESATDGYTLVNASIAYRPFADRPNTAIVLSANNIFDVDARRHSSFLKDFAPLPGRDIRVSLRFTI